MISRHLMWARWIKDVCIVQIRCLAESLDNRIIPSFGLMTEEAEKVEQEAWKRFEESAGLDADPASGAEWAFNKGLDHYMNLVDLQQGIVNFSAAFYYHLFEQQLFYFHRKELLEPQEENEQRLFRPEEVRKRFEEHGIAIQGFKSWPKVDELRLVANVVKHADGPSCDDLKKIRPDMFARPDLRRDPLLNSLMSVPLPVFQPLFGQDFYVTVEDLQTYVAEVIDFWTEMAAILEQQG